MSRHTEEGRGQEGFALVMVLITLAALALSAAGAMRSSSGSDKVVTGFEMQAQALEAAEAALRFCESQLLLPDAQRQAALQDAALPPTTWATAAWRDAARWSSALPSPPANWLKSASALPVCLVEKQAVDGGQIYLITARGFSPGMPAQVSAGARPGGASVGLQSALLVEGGLIRARVQRRLVQTPWR